MPLTDRYTTFQAYMLIMVFIFYCLDSVAEVDVEFFNQDLGFCRFSGMCTLNSNSDV